MGQSRLAEGFKFLGALRKSEQLALGQLFTQRVQQVAEEEEKMQPKLGLQNFKVHQLPKIALPKSQDCGY